MIAGLLARLRRQWRRVLAAVFAPAGIPGLLAATGAGREKMEAGLGTFGLSEAWVVPATLLGTMGLAWMLTWLDQRTEQNRLLAETPVRLSATRAVRMGVTRSSREVSAPRG